MRHLTRPASALLALFALLASAHAQDAPVRAADLAKGDAELEESVALLWSEKPLAERVDGVFTLGQIGRTARGVRAAGILAALVDSGLPALDAEVAVENGGKGYPTLRIAAIRAIGTLGDGTLVPAVVAWLKDPRSEVRFAAVQALGFLGDPGAIVHVREMVQDADAGVREMAGIHLKRLEEFQAARTDLASPDAGTRARACVKLANGKQTGSAPDIAALLDDPTEDVRAAAAAALGELGYADAAGRLAVLLESASPEAKRNAAIALGKLAAHDHAAAVRRLLTDPDASVRAAAAHASGALMDPEAMPDLARLLDDPAVGPNAAAALGRILGTGWGQNAQGVAEAKAWWEEKGREGK